MRLSFGLAKCRVESQAVESHLLSNHYCLRDGELLALIRDSSVRVNAEDCAGNEEEGGGFGEEQMENGYFRSKESAKIRAFRKNRSDFYVL